MPNESIWKSKIVGHDRVAPDQLVANPLNFRTHPIAQREALRDAIKEVGFIRSVTVNKRTGNLIDGHERVWQALTSEQPTIDVEYVDLSEAEERKALATMDPISEMANIDEAKLDELLREVQTESPALAGLFTNMAGIPEEKPPQELTIKPEYSILIKCADESDQRIILEELDSHGLHTRAMCMGWPDAAPVERAEDEKPLGVDELKITRKTKIKHSPRIKQLAGIYDLPPKNESEHTWVVKIVLDRPWNVGLIVGPSGCGKTTIAREIFGDKIVTGWPWPEDRSIIDGFPEAMPLGDIVNLLSSVGFSSPPHWLKPFHVLSNGEQFRVSLARTMAEMPDIAVIDEFTSVVDRTVAQIGSCAVAKAVRASNRRLVAVACHYDIEEWLQPDWKYEPATGKFEWRSLRRRPEIQLQIQRVDGKQYWPLFRGHHYLSGELHKAAACFMATINKQPAAFTAVLHQPGKPRWWRESRTVCLPDFQGVGIGTALSNFVAGMYAATDKKYRSTTSHPAMIGSRMRSPLWRLHRAPSMADGVHAGAGFERLLEKCSATRLTCGFEYIGPARPDDAIALGVRTAGSIQIVEPLGPNREPRTAKAVPSTAPTPAAEPDHAAPSTTARKPTDRRQPNQKPKRNRRLQSTLK